jgi:PAS domain S-box-containing protein
MKSRLTDYNDLEASGRVFRILRYAALISVAAVVIAANVVLFRQIDLQLQRSYTAESDSTPWVLSQVEVELLRYANALSDLRTLGEDKAALDALRLQYDLLYSRVDLIGRHRRLVDLPFIKTEQWAAVAGPKGLVQRALPLIDGPDAALAAAAPQMLDEAKKATQNLRGELVKSMLTSLHAVEDQRGELRSSLQVFSTVALGLLGIMAALMITIYLQSRARERHRQELAQAVYNLRTTIDSSLEAAVILDHDGRVIGCNRAGAEMFSWEEGGRVVRYLSDVVREAKRGAKGLADIAEACDGGDANGQGRITLTGYRASGEGFPLEVSLAQARSANGMPIAIAFLRDISERVEREETLRQARNAAQQGEEAKSRFLAMMSHEMRTPLNGLLSAAELLGAGSRLDPRQSRLVGIIENCGRATLEQVNNILELTRLQASDGNAYTATDFSIGDLVAELVDGYEAEAIKRGNVILTATTGLALDQVHGQRPLLWRVLSNLVSNAVKFTDNGTITIGVDVQPGRGAETFAVRISVTDTGVGIEDANRDRIFGAFETLDSSYSRLKEGSGLGLGIAKLAAEALGGRITVSSRPGAGSTFALFLNLPAADIEAGESGSLVPPSLRNVLSHPMTEGRTSDKPLSVLVVEDNPVNRELLVELLRLHGHSVSVAADGAEGVASANTRRPDVILMDVAMPVMDGLEATRIIRSHGLSQDVPIIGITANADPEKMDSFHSAGMSHVLSKPVNIRLLLSLMSSVTDAAPVAAEPVIQEKGAQLALVSSEAETGTGSDTLAATPQPGTEISAAESDLPPLVDCEILLDLEETLGAIYMAKMANRFVAETDAALLAMDAHAQEGDLSGAAQVAHKNAGAAASLGLKALHRLFVVYERQANAGDGSSAEQTKVMIERIKRDTITLLKERGLTA